MSDIDHERWPGDEHQEPDDEPGIFARQRPNPRHTIEGWPVSVTDPARTTRDFHLERERADAFRFTWHNALVGAACWFQWRNIWVQGTIASLGRKSVRVQRGNRIYIRPYELLRRSRPLDANKGE